MVTNTHYAGDTFLLSEEVATAYPAGSLIPHEALAEMPVEDPSERMARDRALAAEAAVVSVEAQVVQRLRLGDRELRRRKQRR